MNSYIGAPEDERGYWDDKVQPEPECDGCSEPLDEDDWKIHLCKDCQAETEQAERRAYEREHGYVDADDYYGRGRGCQNERLL
jgi:hypothetical protein